MLTLQKQSRNKTGIVFFNYTSQRCILVLLSAFSATSLFFFPVTANLVLARKILFCNKVSFWFFRRRSYSLTGYHDAIRCAHHTCIAQYTLMPILCCQCWSLHWGKQLFELILVRGFFLIRRYYRVQIRSTGNDALTHLAIHRCSS